MTPEQLNAAAIAYIDKRVDALRGQYVDASTQTEKTQINHDAQIYKDVRLVLTGASQACIPHE